METTGPAEQRMSPIKTAADIAIRLAVLAVLIGWCFQILRPFISPVIWGVIIAIAVFPMYQKLNTKLGERRKFTAAIMVIAALLVIVLPSVKLAVSSADSIQTLSVKLQRDELHVPPPPPQVGDWPVIGEPLQQLWQAASADLQTFLARFESQVFAFAKWLLKTIFEATMGLLGFAISIIIAGALMVTAKRGGAMVKSLFLKLAGDRGAEFFEISVNTVRRVVKGILGVSILQSLLAGLGFALAGIPAAGLWAFLCLVLAIIQIGVGPVIIPVIIYAFAKMSTLKAVLLTIWLLLVALADGPVKAVLLGRGAAVPMLVIFLGAIGGFVSFGFLGLFIGAVVLSVGYRLFETWLQEEAR